MVRYNDLLSFFRNLIFDKIKTPFMHCIKFIDAERFSLVINFSKIINSHLYLRGKLLNQRPHGRKNKFNVLVVYIIIMNEFYIRVQIIINGMITYRYIIPFVEFMVSRYDIRLFKIIRNFLKKIQLSKLVVPQMCVSSNYKNVTYRWYWMIC